MIEILWQQFKRICLCKYHYIFRIVHVTVREMYLYASYVSICVL